jgi:hypothetical protein
MQLSRTRTRLAGALVAAALVLGFSATAASAATATTSGQQCLYTDAHTQVTKWVQGDSAVAWCIAMFDASASYGTTAPTVVLKPEPTKDQQIACIGTSPVNGLTFYTFANPDREAARAQCQTQRDQFQIPTQLFISVAP